MAERRGRREAEGAEKGMIFGAAAIGTRPPENDKARSYSAFSASLRPLRFAMVSAVGAMLLLAGVVEAQRPTEADSTLTISFLDVGQGDATWIKPADKRIPKVDVLKAAHHGAENGYSPELARAARPGIVVISASASNSYGHPSSAVIDAWTRAGATVYSTSVHGDVMIVAKMDGTFRVVAHD